MTAREWVLRILPEAWAYESDCGGGWCIDADFSLIEKPIPHLTYGHRCQQLAWNKAARMLGWRDDNA